MALVHITIDGAAIHKSLIEARARHKPLRFPQKDPTPRLARRAREMRRAR